MSNLKFKADIRSYEAAKAFLADADSRELCYKTVVHKDAHGDIAIRHHETDIITYHKESGGITLKTGGWQSVTTCHRLHRLTPNDIIVNLIGGITHVKVGGQRARTIDSSNGHTLRLHKVGGAS